MTVYTLINVFEDGIVSSSYASEKEAKEAFERSLKYFRQDGGEYVHEVDDFHLKKWKGWGWRILALEETNL